MISLLKLSCKSALTSSKLPSPNFQRALPPLNQYRLSIGVIFNLSESVTVILRKSSLFLYLLPKIIEQPSPTSRVSNNQPLASKLKFNNPSSSLSIFNSLPK